MSIKHTFHSAKSDGADPTKVQPSNWNDDHDIDGDVSMATHKLTDLGTPSAGTDAATKAYVDAGNLGIVNLINQDNEFADGTNMTEGEVDTITFVDLPTFTVIIVKGADNGGTRLGGIDPAGIPEGRLCLLINNPQGGTEPTDSGVLVLKNENAATTAANRFSTARGLDHKISCRATCWLRRTTVLTGITGGGTRVRWQVLGQGADFARVVAQSISLYPSLQVGPISGANNNWDPVGNSSYGAGKGIDGGNLNFAQYALILTLVDAGGASITGMKPNHAASNQGTNGDPDTLGDVKIIYNDGPGTLTIKHFDGGSDAGAQFICPNGVGIVLKQYECAGFTRSIGDPSPTSQWRTLFIAKDPTALGTANADELTTAILREYPAQSPSALAAPPTITHDLASGGNGAIVRVTTNNFGSYLGGLIGDLDALSSALSRGERKTIVNVGNGPLVLIDSDGSSGAARRFELPGARPFVIPSLGAVDIFKDDSDKWKVCSCDGDATASISITPSAFPASNVDDWHPTDATSGYDFSYAGWILSQGAVGTFLRSMDPPNGNGHGKRIALSNYNSGYTIKHNAGTGSTGKPFYCPNGVDFILLNLASVDLLYDQGNHIWLVLDPRSGGA